MKDYKIFGEEELELPSLDEVRRCLRDLHFRKTREDLGARERFYYHNVDGLIEQHRAAWAQVRAEGESRGIAEDRASMKPSDERRKTEGFTPRERQIEEERRGSLQAWAIQRFQELVPHDELCKIYEIDLTTEQWANILDREGSLQTQPEG